MSDYKGVKGSDASNLAETPANDIERLRSLGFLEEDVSNLKEAGFKTIASVSGATRNSLLKVKDMTEDKMYRLIETSRKFVKVTYAAVLRDYLCAFDVAKIRTGSGDLDRILDGGIQTGMITELSGESGIGKSQICNNMAVVCQLPLNRGGAAGKCIWIGTADSFRVELIADVAARYNVSKEDTLDNIAIAICRDADHQMELLDETAGLLRGKRHWALLVIDTNFRDLSIDIDFLEKCTELTHRTGLAIVVTKQTSDSSKTAVDVGEINSSISAELKFYNANRLIVCRGEGANRIAISLAPKTSSAITEASFRITNEGIRDIEGS